MNYLIFLYQGFIFNTLFPSKINAILKPKEIIFISFSIKFENYNFLLYEMIFLFNTIYNAFTF